VPINESLITDLNTSVYLDFHAPGIMEAFPNLIAVYVVDTRGIIRHYPNKNLASYLPSDFDARREPYYSIAAPLLNPQRLPHWIIASTDETGGLLATATMPVYDGEQFVGVVAADMQLAGIIEQVNSLKVGKRDTHT
jgi:hypothetical protein